MSDPTSTPISIPLSSSGPDTPLSPDPEGYRPINPSSSPSFDYHQERRLHLKDEIYFSHHLPRLPPPALPQSIPGSGASQQQGSDAYASRASSGPASPVDTRNNILAAGPGSGLRGPMGTRPTANAPVMPLSTGMSPIAFHTRNLGDSIASMRDLNLGSSYTQGMHQGSSDGERNLYYQAESGPEHDPEGSRSTMFSPSAPEDGDLDPRRSFIHRTELDSQERLDLEEEARERMLMGQQYPEPASSAPGQGARSGQLPTAAQPTAQPRPEERECPV